MTRVLSFDGTPITYVTFSPPEPSRASGPRATVLLVHGTLDDHRSWRSVAVALLQRLTCESARAALPEVDVVALNRRGRQGSGPHAVSHGVEHDAGDIVAVMCALAERSPGGVHLVGHSSGARYALHAAALCPDAVRTLVLHEPPPFFAPDEDTLVELRALQSAGRRRALVRLFWRAMVGIDDEELAALERSPAWEMTLLNAHTLVPELESYVRYRFDAARVLGAIDAPTLGIIGTESPSFLREETCALTCTIPRSRLVWLPGQGHDVIHDDPTLFAAVVAEHVLTVEHGARGVGYFPRSPV